MQPTPKWPWSTAARTWRALFESYNLFGRHVGIVGREIKPLLCYKMRPVFDRKKGHQLGSGLRRVKTERRRMLLR